MVVSFIIWWAIATGAIYAIMALLEGFAASRASGPAPDSDFSWWMPFVTYAFVGLVITLIGYGIGSLFG